MLSGIRASLMVLPLLMPFMGQPSPNLRPETEPHAGKLIAIIVVDSSDQAIGATRDAMKIDDWLEKVAAATGLTRETYFFDQHGYKLHGFYLTKIQQPALKVGPQDVVCFYFSGHGAGQNTCKNDPAPVFRPKGGECIAQQKVEGHLMAYKPRLLLTIFDCCVRRDPIRLAVDKRAWGSSLSACEMANIRQLFLGYRGTIRMQSNNPSIGDISYGSTERGGVFTSTFLDIFYRRIKLESDSIISKDSLMRQMTWENILDNTQTRTRKRAILSQRIQVPVYQAKVETHSTDASSLVRMAAPDCN